MAIPSVTYSFINGQTSDGPQVSQNFTDIINSLTDGTKSLTLDDVTCVDLTTTGNNILGNNSSDTLTVNATITSNLIATDATYDIGASGATRFRDLFLSRNATIGGVVLHAAGSVSAPSIAFAGTSSNSGIYLKGADSLGFVSDGAEIGNFASGGAWALGPLLDFTIATRTATITNVTSGNVSTFRIDNTSNDAGSDSLGHLRVAGTSAGDAYHRYTITSGIDISVGVDNSDSDAWKVCENTTLDTTNDHIRLATGGHLRLAKSTGRLGFFGATPVVRVSAYTPSNVTTDRSYDADTVVVAELADVVGTLIADLQSYGLLQ